MPDRHWRFRLDDILAAAANIAEDIAGHDSTSFLEDRRARQAVERNIAIIGEAVRGVPAEVLAQVPDVPWRRIVGARNVLVHGYMDVDHHLVWRMATDRLPALVAAIREMKRRHEENMR